MPAPLLACALYVAAAAPPVDTVYHSPTLVVTALAEGVYVHTSYLAFGEAVYPCNGLLVAGGGESIAVDSPPTEAAAAELVAVAAQVLGAPVAGLVVNHFHDDCLGGCQRFTASASPPTPVPRPTPSPRPTRRSWNSRAKSSPIASGSPPATGRS